MKTLTINPNSQLWKFVSDWDDEVRLSFTQWNEGNLCLLGRGFIRGVFLSAARAIIIAFVLQSILFTAYAVIYDALLTPNDAGNFMTATLLFGIVTWVVVGLMLILTVLNYVLEKLRRVTTKKAVRTTSRRESLFVNYVKSVTGRYCIPMKLEKD